MLASKVLESIQSLGYATDTEAQQLRMLNQVQRRVMNARRWTFALTTIAKETAANQEQVSLGALKEFQRVDAVRVDAGTTPLVETFTLQYAEPEELKEWNRKNLRNTGRPRYWTRFGTGIAFYPIPDAIYKLTLDVVSNASEITTGASEIAIPDSHADILAYGVIMQLTFRERDWDGHNFARQMYAELFTEMLAQYGMKQRQNSTHVNSSGQWENFDVETAWPTSVL